MNRLGRNSETLNVLMDTFNESLDDNTLLDISIRKSQRALRAELRDKSIKKLTKETDGLLLSTNNFVTNFDRLSSNEEAIDGLLRKFDKKFTECHSIRKRARDSVEAMRLALNENRSKTVEDALKNFDMEFEGKSAIIIEDEKDELDVGELDNLLEDYHEESMNFHQISKVKLKQKQQQSSQNNFDFKKTIDNIKSGNINKSQGVTSFLHKRRVLKLKEKAKNTDPESGIEFDDVSEMPTLGKRTPTDLIPKMLEELMENSDDYFMGSPSRQFVNKKIKTEQMHNPNKDRSNNYILDAQPTNEDAKTIKQRGSNFKIGKKNTENGSGVKPIQIDLAISDDIEDSPKSQNDIMKPEIQPLEQEVKTNYQRKVNEVNQQRIQRSTKKKKKKSFL